MKTQGEIEAAVCAGINRFEQEYMGRGPVITRTTDTAVGNLASVTTSVVDIGMDCVQSYS